MKIERNHEVGARLPEDVYEQLRLLPEPEIGEEICKSLFFDIVALLNSEGIKVDFYKSGFRVKSLDRIKAKVESRNSTSPLRDIYGIQIITEERDRERIKDIIQSNYPATPKNFPDGMPSFRDYADTETREYIKSKFNPHISSLYSAMHVNIVFVREGVDVCDIAEVQVMTQAELALYNHTREEYLNARTNNY